MKLHKRLSTLLESIGLSRNESRFYLAVIKNQPATLKDLAIATKLSPSSVYRIYEKLHAMGLITSSEENWRKEIIALPLDVLARQIRKKQRSLRKIELELRRLNTLFGLSGHIAVDDEPIDVITNKDRLREKAFEILSRDWDRIGVYGSAERLIDVIGYDEEMKWVRNRTKNGKGVNVILTEIGDYAHEFLPRNDNELRDVKIDLDEKNQDYMSYIYEGEVTVWQKDPELGNRAIVINDPTIVSMQQKMFDDLWKA